MRAAGAEGVRVVEHVEVGREQARLLAVHEHLRRARLDRRVRPQVVSLGDAVEQRAALGGGALGDGAAQRGEVFACFLREARGELVPRRALDLRQLLRRPS